MIPLTGKQTSTRVPEPSAGYINDPLSHGDTSPNADGFSLYVGKCLVSLGLEFLVQAGRSEQMWAVELRGGVEDVVPGYRRLGGVFTT